MTPCYFFLFGYVKGKLVGKKYETPEDLVSEVKNMNEGIRPDVLKSVSNPGREDYWIAGIPVVNM
jgi:hypothetical protein